MRALNRPLSYAVWRMDSKGMMMTGSSLSPSLSALMKEMPFWPTRKKMSSTSYPCLKEEGWLVWRWLSLWTSKDQAEFGVGWLGRNHHTMNQSRLCLFAAWRTIAIASCVLETILRLSFKYLWDWRRKTSLPLNSSMSAVLCLRASIQSAA